METEKFYPVGGYAPGTYSCTCCICNAHFIGDKRAVTCEPCAVRMEILALRDSNKQMQASILEYRKHLSGLILQHYDDYFKITTNREGKI